MLPHKNHFMGKRINQSGKLDIYCRGSTDLPLDWREIAHHLTHAWAIISAGQAFNRSWPAGGRAMNERRILRFTLPLLLSLLLSSCLAPKLTTPPPARTAVTATPTITPSIPSPTPDLSTFEPVLGLYTDEQAEAFNQRLHRLVEALDGEPVPNDILQHVGIKVDALRVIDLYVGGCPTAYTYELSPGYELWVDDNACFGCFVSIRQK